MAGDPLASKNVARVPVVLCIVVAVLLYAHHMMTCVVWLMICKYSFNASGTFVQELQEVTCAVEPHEAEELDEFGIVDGMAAKLHMQEPG